MGHLIKARAIKGKVASILMQQLLIRRGKINLQKMKNK